MSADRFAGSHRSRRRPAKCPCLIKKSLSSADTIEAGLAGTLPDGGTVPRILIVEDSPTMRSLLTSSLEELDGAVKITEVASGFEALRQLPRETYDLVVTDINMPDINGLELISFVKGNEVYRGIPLIIVSTEGSDRDREKGLALGADAYLVKPFEPDALRDTARLLLERARAGRA